jgi:cell division protein FtsW
MAKDEIDQLPGDGARLPLDQNLAGQGLLLTTLGLLGLGVVMVFSAEASVREPGPWYSRVDVRHLGFAVAAAVVLVTCWRLNVRWLNAGGRFPWVAAAMLAVALGLCALVYVHGIGHEMYRRRRWIRLGPEQYSIGFQPSEVLKLALVIFLAAWLTRPGVKVRSFWKSFLPALALIGGCMGLVITQDFGTAMLIAVAGGVALLLAGVRWWHLGLLVALAAGGFYLFVYCDPYRWGRVQVLIDPGGQDAAAVYQINQSLNAVATGGWWGKGLGLGTVKLGYLPVDSTDFLFAVICEELGFFGAALVMGMLLVWMLLARRAAARAADRFGSVLAGSLGFMIGLQAVLHIAVDLVVAPPKGLGLPFVSAGGTSLVIMAAAAAMIVSVTSRRPLVNVPVHAGEAGP